MTMTPIFTQTVGAGGAASVTFNNIPQTFTDLYVVVSARTTASSYLQEMVTQFNGNATSIYGWRSLDGYYDGSANRAVSGSGTSTYFRPLNLPANNGTTNTYSNIAIYVPNYASTTTNKSVSVDLATEGNFSTTAYSWTLNLIAGLFSSTTAISSISFSGGTFAEHSTFSLYGIMRFGA